MTTLKEHAKESWTPQVGMSPSIEQLVFGALQRIADNTEVMAKRHTELIKDRDMYARWYNEKCAQYESMKRSNAALRGTIKRMKNSAIQSTKPSETASVPAQDAKGEK